MTVSDSSALAPPAGSQSPPHRLLRERTAADHEAVDAAFGGYRLDDRDGYRAFLAAHARVLPGWERALIAVGLLDADRAREPLLRADLAALGAAPSDAGPVAVPPAGLWGALYVLEGSRLGGALLARSVPAGWPAAYLGAKHLPGEWRGTLARIDAALADPDALGDAADTARAVFAGYLAAGHEGLCHG